MKDLTLNLYIISRYTHNYYARELKKELNITMGQFPFIMNIAENNGISQEKLSQKVRISKSTTATVVQQLLKADLITREIDENDRRNFKLFATEKALKLIPKINEIIDICHAEITEDLTDIEKDIFYNLTKKVRARIEYLYKNKKEK